MVSETGAMAFLCGRALRRATGRVPIRAILFVRRFSSCQNIRGSFYNICIIFSILLIILQKIMVDKLELLDYYELNKRNSEPHKSEQHLFQARGSGWGRFRKEFLEEFGDVQDSNRISKIYRKRRYSPMGWVAATVNTVPIHNVFWIRIEHFKMAWDLRRTKFPNDVIRLRTRTWNAAGPGADFGNGPSAPKILSTWF